MKKLYAWEGSQTEEHGVATLFPNTEFEVSVPLPNFTIAHELFVKVQQATEHAYKDGRISVIRQLGDIQP